ncbi:MAG: elongation factor G, partial [Candidatus Binatia bacterium]|nr:elongation factor G [Candidatus Binatia bacterium]
MAAIELDKLRNVGLLGHGGSGKTSLGEALLFSAGVTQRPGRVEDGSSLFDYEPEEIKRHCSLSTAFHSLKWKKLDLTLIDTPGYSPFLPDAVHCMRAFGGAVFVLNPSLGLRVEAERLWNAANDCGIGRLLFVSKMDREESKVEEELAVVLEGLGAKGVALQVPVGSGETFSGVVDLILMKTFLFDGDKGKFSESEIPADLKEIVGEMRVKMIESAVEGDDSLLEKYLDGQELSPEELKNGIRAGTQKRELFPILYGSPAKMIGVPQLLDAIVDYLPSPLDEEEVEGKNPVTQDVEKRAQESNGPFSAFVFKTLIDPFAGRLSIMRIISGKIATDMAVYNANKDGEEKIGHLFKLEGKKQETVREAGSGEIVAASKLKAVSSGDTLCDEKAPIEFPGLVNFPPNISFALEPKSRADEDKVPQGLLRMMEEDLSIEMRRDPQTREFLLSGTGQLHIEVVVEKLKRKYGAEVELKAPKVPYRETIKASSSAQGKYKKQTGGHGQFGDTWIKIEPLGRGKGFEFVNKIVGGAIPRNYIPAVEKG